MKPTCEECYQWAWKGKERIHNHEGRNVIMYEAISTKEKKGTHE
jgi:hypothetical protein